MKRNSIINFAAAHEIYFTPALFLAAIFSARVESFFAVAATAAFAVESAMYFSNSFLLNLERSIAAITVVSFKVVLRNFNVFRI